MKKNMLSMVMAFILFAISGTGYAATDRYVWTNCPTPGPPYNDWTNAAISWACVKTWTSGYHPISRVLLYVD